MRAWVRGFFLANRPVGEEHDPRAAVIECRLSREAQVIAQTCGQLDVANRLGILKRVEQLLRALLVEDADELLPLRLGGPTADLDFHAGVRARRDVRHISPQMPTTVGSN